MRTGMERKFKHLEHFYSANPARRFSPEAGYGVHWRRTGWTGNWRVSYVRDTGEVYALPGGPGDGPLLLLGTFPPDPEAGHPETSTTRGWTNAWGNGRTTAASPTAWPG